MVIFHSTSWFGCVQWTIGVVVLLLLFIYIYGTFPYWKVNAVNIPSAKPWPWIGNLLDLRKYGELHNLHIAYIKKYGRIFKMYLGRVPIIIVSEPKLLKQIMVKQFHNFHDRKAPIQPKPPRNSTLFLLKGEDWKRVRNTITPSFTGGKLKKMIPLIEECKEALMERLTALAKSDHVDARTIMRNYALDVILSVGLGAKIPDLQKNPDPVLLERVSAFSHAPWYVRFHSLLPFPWFWKYFDIQILPNGGYFVDMVTRIINDRRSEDNVQATKRNDVIDMLMSAHHDGGGKILSEDEIIAQSIIVLIAGQETTTNTFSFIAHLLACHPDVQERLIQETDTAWSNKGDKSLYEMVHEIQFLDMVLKEVLRLYPAAFYVNRVPDRDVYIDGILFPAGVEVGIPIYGIHHDPDLWPEPEKFNPDRFTPEAEKNLQPCQYIPFGDGPRHCIGRRLAQLEIKITLCNVLRKFKFEQCPETKKDIDLTLTAFTLSPKDEIYIKIKKR